MWNLATWLLGLPSTLLAAVNGSRRADHRGGDLRTPSPGSPTRLPRAADVPLLTGYDPAAATDRPHPWLSAGALHPIRI